MSGEWRDEPARRALESALRAAVRGDVQFDSGTRAIYATDSSNYRQVPLGVVFPCDHDDVVTVMRIAAEHDAPVLGRGGGTSLAGQACNVGVVLDFSRHMRAILAIDAAARTARVQPGVVLDDLRSAAEQQGLTFGPDPATHAWCTLGGMIGNNSCGTHSIYTGKTVDNVESLRVVLHGGDSFEIGAYADEVAYAAAVSAGDRRAQVLAGLREIGRRYEDLVRERYPDIPRRVSGYNLDQIVPSAGFDVAKAFVGTESTCAIVTEATVTLSRSPRHRRLVVLGYPDVFAAADAVPDVLAAVPLLGLEGFDDVLVKQMQAHELNLAHLPLLPPGGGWLIAEVGDDDPELASSRAEQLVRSLPADVAWRRYDEMHDQRRVWTIRESGLGATARRLDGGSNHEGWEDAAVAPGQLGRYLRGLVALWGKYGYDGALYGHFGDGCVHTRNNFDFATADGLRNYRSFVEEAADLCVSLGGSLSGEHGDGQGRGELLARMYGPELVDAFRQFKAVWDPRGLMNPGKVVDAYPLDADLHHGPQHQRALLQPSWFALSHDGGSLQAGAERCVGVGRCRRDDTGVMCPSYRVTRDEQHSTRGRAKLLAEMMQGEVTPQTWRNEDVREALDLCLACKGCAVDCPTHVDMATYKSEFFAHYYAGRLRPRATYTLGLLPWAARIATAMPALANSVAGQARVRRSVGVTTERPPPLFARLSLRRRPAARSVEPTVVVWPDTFSDAFRPAYGEATVAALAALGETVHVPTDWACCGRTLFDGGMLDLARSSLRRVLDVLEPFVAAGLPVVVPEPSCLAAFRDELPELLPDDPRAAGLAGLAVSLSQHLVRRPELLDRTTRRSGRVLVHPHCHGRAVGTSDADREVLERLGYDVEVLDAGCCGLAGSFGYNAKHADVGRRIGEEWWLPKLRDRAATADVLVVDGFSCALQLEHLDGRRATTFADLVLRGG